MVQRKSELSHPKSEEPKKEQIVVQRRVKKEGKLSSASDLAKQMEDSVDEQQGTAAVEYLKQKVEKNIHP